MIFSVNHLRTQFPFLKSHPELIYLDNAATTQKPEAVTNVVLSYYTECTANVHRGGYKIAEEATARWEQARQTVAQFIGSDSSREIIFTRGTTEAINLLAFVLLQRYCKASDTIVVSQLEHHSNLLPWRVHAERNGLKLEILRTTPEGRFDLNHFQELLLKKPKIISVTACSNVLGVDTQISELIPLARAAGALTVIDVAQLVLHQRISVRELGCDFLAFSGHKMFGPTGIGVLYGRSALLEELPPWQYGGEMVEEVTADSFVLKPAPWKFEAGTPPIAEAIGLAAAIEFLSAIDPGALRAHNYELAVAAIAILQSFPEITIYGSTEAEERVGPIAFNFAGIHAHDIIAVLDAHGVAARAGSHCAHPLMQHLGIPTSVRISFAPYNTVEELQVLKKALEKAEKLFKRNRGR